MNNVLALQRSGYVAPTDYYKVGSSPSDMIRQHDTLAQIRNVDVQSDHGKTSFSELLHGNADSQLVNILKGAVSRQSSSFCLILPITRPQSLWNLK